MSIPIDLPIFSLPENKSMKSQGKRTGRKVLLVVNDVIQPQPHNAFICEKSVTSQQNTHAKHT